LLPKSFPFCDNHAKTTFKGLDLRGRRYAFYGVWAQDYARMMQPRSLGWQTVFLRAQDFRRLRQPLLDLL